MLSIEGIYDGEKIRLTKDVKLKSPQKVIVTFLEETENGLQREIYSVAEKSSAFNFLKEPAEDIYTDRDLKVKYRE